MKIDEMVELNKKHAKVINELSHNQRILIDKIGKMENAKSNVDTNAVVNEAVDRIISQVEKKTVAPATPATPAPTPAEPAPTAPEPAAPAEATPPAEPAKG